MKKAACSNRRLNSHNEPLKHTETLLPKQEKSKLCCDRAVVAPRNFDLSGREAAKVSRQYQVAKQSADPSMKGFYHYLWEALITLGPNKNHSQAAVMPQLKKLVAKEHTVSS